MQWEKFENHSVVALQKSITCFKIYPLGTMDDCEFHENEWIWKYLCGDLTSKQQGTINCAVHWSTFIPSLNSSKSCNVVMYQ